MGWVVRAICSAGCGAVMTGMRSAIRAETAVADADDTDSPIEPVKCVIVGGGYAGSRLAYQLDSVFHVTLIDTKNFYEASDEITTVLTAPTDEAFEERLKDCHALHRFYLRRARVITNRVVDADESTVLLADGRRVPYDMLVLAVGETRPYPFDPAQMTCDTREEELRHFYSFLKEPKRRKIAVVGGGPRGVSLANCLAMRYLDKEVHLFHSTSTFAPDFPYEARERIDAVLSSNTHVHLHRNSVVNSVRMDVKGLEAASPPLEPPKKKSWWSFFSGNKHDDTEAAAARAAALLGAPDTEIKYTLDVSLREDTKVKIPSVIYQAWSGESPKHEICRGKEIGRETISDFDYVFNCTGNNGNGRQFSSSAFLKPHIDAKGQFIASRYMQLLGHPTIFAIGRCNNFKWLKSMGNSDFQARTLFRNMLSVANMNEVRTGNLVPTMTPLLNKSMTFPRIIVPLDEYQAAGSIAWNGSVVGPIALKELIADRKYYLREFANPIFFKQQVDKKVRESFDAFFKQCVTDVSDFDLE